MAMEVLQSVVLLSALALTRASLPQADATFEPASLECSGPDGLQCINVTDPGCDSAQKLCTCQVGVQGRGFVCGRTCNGRPGEHDVHQQQCSPEMSQLVDGCPACCSAKLFNTTGCAACYRQECTFDCDVKGAICSAQCVENCFAKSMVDGVHLFSYTFWHAPFKDGTCMADCWRGNWVQSVKEQFTSISTTSGVVLPYLCRFIFDFAGGLLWEQLASLVSGMVAAVVFVKSRCGQCCGSGASPVDHRSSGSTNPEQQPLLSPSDTDHDSELQRGVSISGPAQRSMAHKQTEEHEQEDEEHEQEDEEVCLKPCSQISCCSSKSAYAKWSMLRQITGCLAMTLTLLDFVLQVTSTAFARFRGSTWWDEIVLSVLWVVFIVLRVSMWKPTRATTVYAPGSQGVDVPAAPGFTMFDLQGHKSSWAEATKARGFSDGEAKWHAVKRIIFWHLSQPGMYAVVVYVYWSSLMAWQKVVAGLVAFRELTYVFLLMVSTWYNPAFLLVDISRSMGSMDDTLHPVNGWFSLVVYVFGPEKFVGMALLQRQTVHSQHTCCSGNSPYVQPRNKKYRADSSGDNQNHNYLPRWVSARVVTGFVWVVVALDICGSAALFLNYVPSLRQCVQFKNTVAGGRMLPPELFDHANPCAQGVVEDARYPISASQCVTNSKDMIKQSTGRLWCRYTTWPDALLWCYLVTFLSGFVFILFGIYRWFFPAESRTLLRNPSTGKLEWMVSTQQGQYRALESGKLIDLSGHLTSAHNHERKARSSAKGRSSTKGRSPRGYE